VQQLERNAVPMTGDTVRRDPAPIGRIVFLDYRSGSHSNLTRLSAGEAAIGIIGSLTNFQDHREAAVARSVAIAHSIPAFRLTFGHPAERAAEIIGGI
jgi:hypothetical protein